MKPLLMVFICLAMLCVTVDAGAGPNALGKWVLHYAGPHDAESNACSTAPGYCEWVVTAPAGSGRYDIYVVAADVIAVAGTRYGIFCDGSFYFYGWTKCSDFESPTAGWPGCGEANAQTWSVEQPGYAVTIGILDVYAYGGNSKITVGVDPRVGFAEYCDGSSPSAQCDQTVNSARFGWVGFGGLQGYMPVDCGLPVPVDTRSWGALKALYR